MMKRDSSRNILRKSAREGGYKARSDESFGCCMRLTKLGLLARLPGRVFVRTDLPDNRPTRQAEHGTFDFAAHRRTYQRTNG